MDLYVEGRATALATRLKRPLFLARITAGFPSPADDFIEGQIDLNTHLIQHPAATFFVRVTGDSMTGAGIFPGDLLIVDRALPPSDGSVIIAVLNGELTLKRLRNLDGRLFLAPDNPAYKPIPIKEAMDFSVWGVVAFNVHKVS